MTPAERRTYLIRLLLGERGEVRDFLTAAEARTNFLRARFNLRQPWPICEEFLWVQDGYFQGETHYRGSGLQHAGHYQIPILADDSREPVGGIRLRKHRADTLPQRDCKAGGLPGWRH